MAKHRFSSSLYLITLLTIFSLTLHHISAIPTSKALASMATSISPTTLSAISPSSGHHLIKVLMIIVSMILFVQSQLERESVDEAQQADESKFTTTSSEHMDQVVKGDSAEEVDPTIDRSPKSVMSNGVNGLGNEEASIDQEPPKRTQISKALNKEDTVIQLLTKNQTQKNRPRKIDEEGPNQ